MLRANANPNDPCHDTLYTRNAHSGFQLPGRSNGTGILKYLLEYFMRVNLQALCYARRKFPPLLYPRQQILCHTSVPERVR
jgi:hypothetical protein